MACINKLNEILLAFYVSNCWHILNWICKEKKRRWRCLRYFDYSSSRFSQILSPRLKFLLFLLFELKYRWWPNLRKNQTAMNFCCTSHLFLCFLCFSLSLSVLFLYFLCVWFMDVMLRIGGNCGMGCRGSLLT